MEQTFFKRFVIICYKDKFDKEKRNFNCIFFILNFLDNKLYLNKFSLGLFIKIRS